MSLPMPHPRRRWQPTPLIWLSLLLHGAVVLLFLLYPDAWPWWLLALLLDQLWLTAAGLWPRSRSLGPNWVRLPVADGQIAITIDDGPDPLVTPQVLDLLDRFGARASFFCIGEQARRHPDLCREIVRHGHAVENHSQNHHHHFALFGPWRMTREISAAQDTLTEITGQRPLFFRPTAGLRNPFLEPILAQHGLHLASWTRRGFDTRNRDADDVVQRLTHRLAAGDILLLHDGNAACTASNQPMILEVLPRVLQAAANAGLKTVTLRSAQLQVAVSNAVAALPRGAA
jgi:peptidoglycan/xylan/chitin deacetylase (PgdA/CDA1 family)